MKLHDLFEMRMPPQDARKWLEDLLDEAGEYGDINPETMDDVWDNDKLMWKMTDEFLDMVRDIEETLGREQREDAIYDAALEVYHQNIGPVKKKERR